MGKVVNLQRDFAMRFATGTKAQRYDPIDYLAIPLTKKCPRHDIIIEDLTGDVDSKTEISRPAYLEMASKQKHICFECLLRWYTVEAEEGLCDRYTQGLLLTSEIDEFLSIEE